MAALAHGRFSIYLIKTFEVDEVHSNRTNMLQSEDDGVERIVEATTTLQKERHSRLNLNESGGGHEHEIPSLLRCDKLEILMAGASTYQQRQHSTLTLLL